MPVIAPTPGVPTVVSAQAPSRSPSALCPNPVFILGAPRSGTSILVWALAQHPRLWGSSESNLLYHLFGDSHIDTVFEALSEQHGASWLREQGIERGEMLRHLGLGVNAVFSSRSAGKRWIDKSIPNTMMADVLGEMFPGASFIHILRDGRQVVHSMVHAQFVDPNMREFPAACRTWRTYVDAADAFCASHPQRSLTVFYDRLVAAPEHELQRIFRFLDLEQDPAPAAFFRSNRINSSFASTPNAPIRSGDSAGWRQWSDEQRQIFWDEAAMTLREYCRVPAAELDALRPAGAAPLADRTPPTPQQRLEARGSAGPASVTHSLQQQLRDLQEQFQERTAWATDLAATVAHRDATIEQLQASHNEQAIRARRFEARLARLEGSLPVRLYRWARRCLPGEVGECRVDGSVETQAGRAQGPVVRSALKTGLATTPSAGR
jgi:hypothetical protein